MKKGVWQEPHLLKHGVYVASVENYSNQPFRIITVGLEAENESNEGISFSTRDESNGIEIEIIPKESGILCSKTSYIKPEVAANELSKVEGVSLRIEDTDNPAINKVLWVVRKIDDEEINCTVDSYFHDAQD